MMLSSFCIIYKGIARCNFSRSGAIQSSFMVRLQCGWSIKAYQDFYAHRCHNKLSVGASRPAWTDADAGKYIIYESVQILRRLNF
jgi:hypothetical protein